MKKFLEGVWIDLEKKLTIQEGSHSFTDRGMSENVTYYLLFFILMITFWELAHGNFTVNIIELFEVVGYSILSDANIHITS